MEPISKNVAPGLGTPSPSLTRGIHPSGKLLSDYGGLRMDTTREIHKGLSWQIAAALVYHIPIGSKAGARQLQNGVGLSMLGNPCYNGGLQF